MKQSKIETQSCTSSDEGRTSHLHVVLLKPLNIKFMFRIPKYTCRARGAPLPMSRDSCMCICLFKTSNEHVWVKGRSLAFTSPCTFLKKPQYLGLPCIYSQDYLEVLNSGSYHINTTSFFHHGKQNNTYTAFWFPWRIWTCRLLWFTKEYFL